MEGAPGYIEKAVVPPLVIAVAEVCDKRPTDPIAYIANSLLTQNRNKTIACENAVHSDLHSPHSSKNNAGSEGREHTFNYDDQDASNESDCIETDLVHKDIPKHYADSYVQHVHSDFSNNFGDLFDDEDLLS